MGWSRAVAVIGGPVLVAALLVAPARAALPGENGRIVYQAAFESEPTEIWSANPDGTHKQRVTRTPNRGELEPSAGPGGRLVAFTRMDEGDLDVFLARVDRSKAELNLTAQSPADDKAPSFGPDGRIVFVSDRAESDDVFVMAKDGSEQVNLTPNSPGEDTEPSFSGAGDQIAFQSDRDGDPDIYTVASDGSSQAVNLSLDLAEGDSDPAFSPDGTTVAFSGLRGDPRQDPGRDVWLIQADGSNLRKAIDFSGNGLDEFGGEAAFSPDGRKIVVYEDSQGQIPHLSVTDLFPSYDLGFESSSVADALYTPKSAPDWAVRADGVPQTFIRSLPASDDSRSSATSFRFRSTAPGGVLRMHSARRRPRSEDAALR